MKDTIAKPKNVGYFQVPEELWQLIKPHFATPSEEPVPGRARACDRAALNGIWYVLWTGCQWKAVHRTWFGVCSSVIHDRFQTWQQAGLFDTNPGRDGPILYRAPWNWLGVAVGR